MTVDAVGMKEVEEAVMASVAPWAKVDESDGNDDGDEEEDDGDDDGDGEMDVSLDDVVGETEHEFEDVLYDKVVAIFMASGGRWRRFQLINHH